MYGATYQIVRSHSVKLCELSVAPQVLKARCAECRVWLDDPAGARYGACLDTAGNGTCVAAASDGGYATAAAKAVGGAFAPCGEHDGDDDDAGGDNSVTDVVLTSGRCKRYEGALALQVIYKRRVM